MPTLEEMRSKSAGGQPRAACRKLMVLEGIKAALERNLP
jgi:hypothetical protein